MVKKINSKTIKLIKFYNLINYNLVYNNMAINRYKKGAFEISGDKLEKLEKLKKSISKIKNCQLKDNASNIVFSDGNPKSKIMLIGEGPGFNESSTQKIFKRFYSNRPTKFGEHSGLGLNIVKNIVELHKGTVSASNRAGMKGAQIQVLLPKSI